MVIYVVMIEDRHMSSIILVYKDKTKAIETAKLITKEHFLKEDFFGEIIIEKGLEYSSYSEEKSLTVMKKTLIE